MPLPGRADRPSVWGTCALILPICDFVLELRRAPAGAPVEPQPVLHADGLGLCIMREDAGMGDGIARAHEPVIGMLASRIDFLAADHRGWCGRIAFGLSRNLAHVAVLAGDAGLARRAVAILLPDDLQLYPQVDGNLVAAHAELRLGDLVVCNHALVDIVAAPIFAGFDQIGVFVGEDVFDHALFATAVDRIINLSRFDPALAVDLAVLFADPVAGDAGHALARNRAARPKRCLAGLAKLGADLLVAAHAEGADRALRQFLELLLELVEHGRDRRIGMLRRGPLLVDLAMAFAAFFSGGIKRECFIVDRGNRYFLAVRCGVGDEGLLECRARSAKRSQTRRKAMKCGIIFSLAPTMVFRVGRPNLHRSRR